MNLSRSETIIAGLWVAWFLLMLIAIANWGLR